MLNMKIGFDTDKYLEEQTRNIKERVGRFEKLYLEFGGKLCNDMHAARVLPGYRPSAKMELLKKLGEIDLIYCVSAKDLARSRVRRDFGLTYDNQTLKDIGDITDFGLKLNSVVVTRYAGEAAATAFISRLKNFGIAVFAHTEIPGYPQDLDKVLNGYNQQPYIETKQNIVVMTGPGGGSGKMATCLCQVFKERQLGKKTGYAKFETFPIWNLPLNHPINVAYEASTADMKDTNEIDPFHEKAYGVKAVNYNRDIENFKILIKILEKVSGEAIPFGYQSPTDMGVNVAATGIIDDIICSDASKQEIIRRYFRYAREKIEGVETAETINQINKIMEKAGLTPEDRKVVAPARQAAEDAKNNKGFQGVFCGAAIQLPNDQIITGKNSAFLHAESAAILNAVKTISNISDTLDLISPEIIHSVTEMKTTILKKQACSLDVEEMLIALAISSQVNPIAKVALNKLEEIRGCEMHITHLPKHGDETGLMRLGLNVTSDAKLSLLKHFQ